MEKNEIKKILKFYKSIYPNSKINELNVDTINSWHLMLEDYTYEQVQNALVKFFKQKNKYMPNLSNIIENIDIPDYEVIKIAPHTVIIHFEDETYGNFPFRFETNEEARRYAKMFKDCDYDKDTIRELHQEFTLVKAKDRTAIHIHGIELSKYNQMMEESKRRRRYDK